MAVRPPAVKAFTFPATELIWSPCRWWKLLRVEAAEAASEADTDEGSLCSDEAVCRAARFWAQVVPEAGAWAAVWEGAVEGGVCVAERMPKPGTDIPFAERLLTADWLR